MSSAGGSQEKYASYMLSQIKHKRKIRILKVVVFVAVFTIVLLIIRNNYLQLINNLGSWGWLCALAHQYPPLAYLFFRNASTPDAIVNMYYACINSQITLQPSSTCDTRNWTCVEYMFDPSNFRSVLPTSVSCTVAGFMENNPSAGFQDLMTQFQTVGIIPKDQTIGDKTKSAVNFVTSYVLPFVSLAVMII